MPISFKQLHDGATSVSPDSPTSVTALSNSSLSTTATTATSLSTTSTSVSAFLKAVFARSESLDKAGQPEPDSPDSPWSESGRRRQRTLVRRSSQSRFKARNQTIVILDWDDTLFPTTFVEQQFGNRSGVPAAGETDKTEEELKDAMNKIEDCQASTEALLHCIQRFGRIIIVTLSSRSKLSKLCEAWYPRVWKLLKDTPVNIVYALEYHKVGTGKTPDDLTNGYWAWVKGRAIAKQIDGFYSQYEGQTWKNVISIGDSNFERYGTLGAANAYVQRRFGNATTTESDAYVQGWRRFDSDPDWSQRLEGNHDGHIFKVRAKLLKLVEDPSPADVVQQLTLLMHWFPQIVYFDGCLNLSLDNLNEKAQKELELLLTPVATSSQPDELDPFECYITPDEYSVDEQTVADRKLNGEAVDSGHVPWTIHKPKLDKLIRFLETLNEQTVRSVRPRSPTKSTKLSAETEDGLVDSLNMKLAPADINDKVPPVECECREEDAECSVVWC
eukprot:gnl/MRDRNA2_/MRDRNA2_75825_c0_seq3.p1 gnl/MRDRNA2_/MRDRNA2_75825_c0~~gnl/MRDRNA2_/MRDRNA2_75825_c0_seq3.p1  ORF type:complete len:501 (+),score=96.14 gnl/MRDRNA2_/MRDRNA2_75825_c0_seq3:120-1622(+)